MKSIIDELRCGEQDQPLSPEAVSHLVTMNTLYRAGLITRNELSIGLGGKSIGAAGDRFASEDRHSDRPQFD